MLEYTPDNLKLVNEVILNNLTPDLLPKKWVERNASNPMFGHCHNASGCLYKIFGSKQLSLYRGFDGEIYHWWVQDKSGKIIDLTLEQYTSIGKIPPYDKAEKSGLLGFDYKKRVIKLHDRVVNELSGNKLGLINHYE